MNLILVDSSIWIDLLRHRHFSETLTSLAADLRLSTCAVVQAEVFPFFKGRPSKTNLLSSLHYFPFRDEEWQIAFLIQQQILDARFNPLSIPDLLIATICRIHGLQLFTKDKDFSRVKDVISLDLYDWKS